MKTQNNQPKTTIGFTLVELIVVIVILAILSTIAFLSFNSYSSSSRDTVRITDIANISKGILVQYTVSGKYPIPDNYIIITASGTSLGYQGKVGTNVKNIIKISEPSVDPLDKTEYTYSTNLGQDKYQLLWFLEDNIAYINNPLLNQVFAFDYSNRKANTKGDTLGILLSSGSLEPVENLKSLTFTGVDLINEGTGKYITKLSNTETINDTILSKYSSGLVGYWDMESTTIDGKLKDLTGNGNDLSISGVIQIGNGVGKFNKATSFDGTSKYFYKDSSDFNFDGNFTIIAWANTFTGGNIVTKTTNWKDGYALQRVFNNKNYFTFVTGSGTGFAPANSLNNSILDNNWQMVSGIHNKDTNIIYINNIMYGTKTGALSITTPSINTFNIGSVGNGLHNFSGIIDEVRIYNRALSDTEISVLYNNTK
ncbi:MAG: prepilin-type N-terminal cleavage/methylation domain-containing protein [Candidatus Gracilibacteria bacterium]|nr:prepilin-type N-terminal cleavage/methylation domain-containing protein [Candidatus Gracilibacteria bacterium]MDD2909030.1 prepilin-type N-terminal cleavage/methylation domain-containing protein [Candidatus Gracilibacteria bacterium]